MFVSNNRASFHLQWKENLVKHQKVSKDYQNDFRLAPSVHYIFTESKAASYYGNNTVSKDSQLLELSLEEVLSIMKGLNRSKTADR